MKGANGIQNDIKEENLREITMSHHNDRYAEVWSGHRHRLQKQTTLDNKFTHAVIMSL